MVFDPEDKYFAMGSAQHIIVFDLQEGENRKFKTRSIDPDLYSSILDVHLAVDSNSKYGFKLTCAC
jgi:hypothetical protein